MTNFDLALVVFSVLKQAGAENLIVCAGARNAPMVLALEAESSFKIYNFFEERCAAFFALGLVKATGKPVAILTTSGTAVAELLPAVIEAKYQGLPLILVTADRPKKYRGTGAPQTIEQVGLFSSYVESVYDLDVNAEKFDLKWSLKKPLHLNVSFDEPLIDQRSATPVFAKLEITSASVETGKQLKEFSCPLIILGEIPHIHKNHIADFISNSKAPVYAESLSQIRNFPNIRNQLIHSSELVKKIFKLKLCDSVIRIGGVPTLRFWRDLENEFEKIPVYNFTDLPFTGLSRFSNMAEISALKVFSEFQYEKLNQIMRMNEKLETEKEKLFEKYPLSEQSFTKKISEIVSTDSVYLGNSLPIRNWDQFANCKSTHIYANRGANGIDGQISTYLGWSEREIKSYCYVGDLTALYDLAALGLAPQLNKNQRNIIVLNNFGGQIFSRVFKNNDFINSHSTQFFHWAKMWNWNYIQISNSENLNLIGSSESQFNVIEVLPNAEQTQNFWDEWDLLCQQI